MTHCLQRLLSRYCKKLTMVWRLSFQLMNSFYKSKIDIFPMYAMLLDDCIFSHINTNVPCNGEKNQYVTSHSLQAIKGFNKKG